MRILSAYLLKDIIRPTLVALFVLLSIIWLLQSLRFLDLIINKGLGAITFFHMTALLVPSLLIFVLPVAFFAGVCISYKRLNDDNEISPLFSAGLSRTSLFVPTIKGAIIATMACYALSLYLMPAGMTAFKQLQNSLRQSADSLLVEEGTFNQMGDLMVYIEKREGNHSLTHILVHDVRDPKSQVTWMAKSGELIRSAEGTPRLILEEGSRQEVNEKRITTLSFTKHTLDINRQFGEVTDHWRDAEERFLWELDPTKLELSPKQINRFKAEFHKRLVWPLAPFAMAFIAAVVLLRPKHNRLGMAKNTMFAVALGFAYLSIMIALTNVASNGANAALYGQWALPVLTVIICSIVMLTKKRKVDDNA